MGARGKIIAILVLAGQAVFADPRIIGKWKLTGGKCSSGAPHYMISPNSGFSGKAEILLEFTKEEMRADIAVQMKINKSVGERTLREYKEELAEWEKKADSPEKQESVVEYNKSIKAMEQYISGVNCSIKEVVAYKLKGSSLLTGKSSRTTTCPYGGQSESETASTYEIKGDSLSIAHKAAQEFEASCPAGDFMTSTYTRVK